jgi:hypothetical protein
MRRAEDFNAVDFFLLAIFMLVTRGTTDVIFQPGVVLQYDL